MKGRLVEVVVQVTDTTYHRLVGVIVEGSYGTLHRPKDLDAVAVKIGDDGDGETAGRKLDTWHEGDLREIRYNIDSERYVCDYGAWSAEQ